MAAGFNDGPSCTLALCGQPMLLPCLERGKGPNKVCLADRIHAALTSSPASEIRFHS